MVFHSSIFVFYFLPAVLFFYYCIGRKHALVRKVIILLASYFFYAWFNAWFVLLLLIGTAANFAVAPLIAETHPKRKLFITISVISNVGILVFFKYYAFFQCNLNSLMALMGGQTSFILRIIVPAGVSFYTFRILSYNIDVYRGQSVPERSLLDFACYVAFFPQLLSGPIQRYGTTDIKSGQLRTFSEQIKSPDCSIDRVAFGAALFIVGFAKKVLLANSVADVADAVFAASAPLPVDAWYGALGYSLQLYVDFSAYSEMAIGLGSILGFACPRNFNAPYCSGSITEFWRRWHISLSSWFRDYLYIPLGGDRSSNLTTYCNLSIVFFLCGLWHGANWTFIAWGLYHGAFLLCERALGKKPLYTILPKPIQVACTFLIVTGGWILFRADSVSHALNLLAGMLGFSKASAGSSLLAAELYTREHVLAMAACTLMVFQPVQAIDWAKRLNVPKMVLLILLFCVSLMTMFTQSFSPFLYFQF